MIDTLVVTGEPWISRIHNFASALDLDWRCNITAVRAGHVDRSVPTEAAIRELAGRDDSLVLAMLDGETLVGYIMSTGSYVRWMGLARGEQSYMGEIIRTMSTAICDRYGSLWGRVSNDALRALVLASIDGARVSDEDDQVVIAGGHP
jgi:hypothetical protein